MELMSNSGDQSFRFQMKEMDDSTQSSPSRNNAYNPPSAKPLAGSGGEDTPQGGNSCHRNHQQISPVTVLPKKDNSGDNQSSHKNSRHHHHQQKQASPAGIIPENDNLHNQSSHENSYHHHHQQPQQASPATVLPENENPDDQSSHKNSHHHHHPQQQTSPVTVLPGNNNTNNQNSHKNSHHHHHNQYQHHQSVPWGQDPPPSGFHQEDQSSIQENSDDLNPPNNPRIRLTSYDPPVNSHGCNHDKQTASKAHDQTTNIVHNNVIVINSHQQIPNPQPSRERLSMPPGYPNKSGPPKLPPKKGIFDRCLEETFPCCF